MYLVVSFLCVVLFQFVVADDDHDIILDYDGRVVPPNDDDDDGVDFEHVPISSVESFWNSRPCNIGHSRLPIGSRSYFDEVERRKYRVEPHIVAFANFSQWHSLRVLELGCGLATETINFVRAGAHVTAVDISARSVQLAQQRMHVYGLNASIIHGDMEHLLDILIPLRDHVERYDLVWCFGSLHHTPHPSAVLQHAHAMLKQGGELRMMVYSTTAYKVFHHMNKAKQWTMNKEKQRKLMAFNSEAKRGSPVTYTYTIEEVKRMLSHGWKVTSVRKYHIFTWDEEEYAKGNFVKDKAWEGVSDDYLSDLEQELGWHLCVTAVKI